MKLTKNNEPEQKKITREMEFYAKYGDRYMEQPEYWREEDEQECPECYCDFDIDEDGCPNCGFWLTEDQDGK